MRNWPDPFSPKGLLHRPMRGSAWPLWCWIGLLVLVGCGDNGKLIGWTNDSDAGIGPVDGGVTCPNGATTTLTGTAFAPNGTLPLYNALVFVPTGDLPPVPTGPTCDQCSSTGSGYVIASARTDALG